MGLRLAHRCWGISSGRCGVGLSLLFWGGLFLGEVMLLEAAAESKPEVKGVVVLLCGLQAGPEGAKSAHAVLEFVVEGQAEIERAEAGAEVAGEFTHEGEDRLVVWGLQPERCRLGEEIEGRDKWLRACSRSVLVFLEGRISFQPQRGSMPVRVVAIWRVGERPMPGARAIWARWAQVLSMRRRRKP